jgi:hypothetical protein
VSTENLAQLLVPWVLTEDLRPDRRQPELLAERIELPSGLFDKSFNIVAATLLDLADAKATAARDRSVPRGRSLLRAARA